MSQRRMILAFFGTTLVAVVVLVWLFRALVEPVTQPLVTAHLDSMKRVTPAQYRNIVRHLFGSQVKIEQRFVDNIERSDGLLAVGATQLSVSPVGFQVAEKMARAIAAQVIGEPLRAELIACRPAQPDGFDSACAQQFLGQVGRLLFRRPLSDAELQSQLEIAQRVTEQSSDFYAGLEKSLASMLVSPQFLFRIEYAEADPNDSGAYRLTAYAKASRLSFLLWNSAPDDQLLMAAERGELHTRDGLKNQVERMLQSPWLVDGVRAFFDDMLALDGFDQLAKDAEIFPDFTTRAALDAREQTLRTIVDHVLAKERDYRDLFTTRDTLMTPSLAAVYGVPLVQRRRNTADERWVPYRFGDNDPRAGILAQTSFVALHSYPGRTSPTLRGKALREHLLCQEVPLPPPDVNFNLVEDDTNPDYKTMRQRLSAHATDPTCAGCHKITDPIGLALESFDGIGRYRTSENGASIDTSGAIDGVEFADAIGLGNALRDNPAVVSCVVNRLYSYGTGRPIAATERRWLKSLHQNFAEQDYQFKALLRSVALSDRFYRGSPSEEPEMASR